MAAAALVVESGDLLSRERGGLPRALADVLTVAAVGVAFDEAGVVRLADAELEAELGPAECVAPQEESSAWAAAQAATAVPIPRVTARAPTRPMRAAWPAEAGLQMCSHFGLLTSRGPGIATAKAAPCAQFRYGFWSCIRRRDAKTIKEHADEGDFRKNDDT